MNILILHRVRYVDVLYHQSIDHELHNVYYIGIEENLNEIPADLRCTKIVRPGVDAVHKEVLEQIENLDVCFDHVVSINEFELIEAALIREKLNIAGPKVADVEKVRNKIVMKHCVGAVNIRIPQYMSLSDFMNSERLAIPPSSQVILKPLDGASSVDVVKFDSQKVLEQALIDRTTGIVALDKETPERIENFEVEEFVSGPVLHIDGMIRNGQIEMIVVSQYINTLLDFANGYPAGSVQLETTEEMKTWALQILNAVEISLGAFHLEAIQTDTGPVFLEIAHRIGGARIAETLTLQTGIHPSILELGLLLDPDFKFELNYDTGYKYAWFIVPGHQLPGNYGLVSGHEFLYGKEEVVMLNQLTMQQPLVKAVTYKESEIPLAGLLKAKSAKELTDLIDRLFGQLQLISVDTPLPYSECMPQKKKHVLVIGNIRQPHKTLEAQGYAISWMYKKVPNFTHTTEDHNRCERILMYSNESAIQLISLARSIDQLQKIDSVVSFHDGAQLDALTIANALELPFSLSMGAIVNTRDKQLSRRILREKNLTEVQSAIAENEQDLHDFFKIYPQVNKVIVKPVAGTGSENVRSLESKELETANLDNVYPVLVEQFVEGREFSVEAFMQEGKCHIFAITEKFKDAQSFIETGHLVPARLSSDEHEKIAAFIAKVLPALGVVSGITHSEIMLGEKIELIETHTRVGGDRIFDLVQMTTGIDMYRLQALQSLGLPIGEDELTPKLNGKHACIKFKLNDHPGKKVIRVNGEEEIKNWSGVEDVSITHQAGEVLPQIVNSFDRSASVLVLCDSSEQALSIAEEAIQKLEFVVGE
ncbi:MULTISPECIES: ATP-grasp domain-containing protein [Photorhabdus]|uniref:ATP-grasp domain-containing protein n=1 Tax=Photorhabdus TaxID=29487 RepID=UPI0007B470EA|nr:MULTISPECIES: ATP-grasp domain-containing protein [Photorhabdus]AWK41308.1 hypothetical protein A4R40_07250 [Photorhabdus laumondii subsp. laumondii]AXG42041.1 hypothetical protein PluDJC_07060 [Photorhabdus laumondii subsp. laumondii]MCC8387552.1 ATP-grasp domain-containing protein [Photorhabdus laumondii]MCZ1250473.1 ATP-grasp domain-containing protein [Photorhabdus laumondii subsp. laumondii]NDL16800.1 ATP-grasp domain-containing protein [Photorhabdus laumondii subsp. laumondii]